MRNVLVAVIIGVILAVAIWVTWQLRGSGAADATPPEIEVLDAPGTSASQNVNVAGYTIRLAPNANQIARIDYELVQAAPVQQPTATPTPRPAVETQSEAPTPTPVTPTAEPTAIPPTATPEPVIIAPTTAPTVGCNGVTTVAHTVQAGETLYGLAEQYNTTVVKMAECDIASGDMRPGNVIYVPQNTGSGIIITGNVTCNANSQTHIVQQGENVFRIGLRYGVDKDAIRVANNLNVNYLIYPGDILCIP